MSREILEAAADRYNARRSAATGVEEGDDDDVLMVDGQQTAMMLLGFGIDGEYLFKHANAHARMLAEHHLELAERHLDECDECGVEEAVAHAIHHVGLSAYMSAFILGLHAAEVARER